MSKILVTIPSRTRPQKLQHTIELIESKAKSKDNYDLQIVINDDESSMYEGIRKSRPDINWHSLPFKPGNMRLIYLYQFDYFLAGDYSILWYLPDDMLKMPQDWDFYLKEKENAFEDKLFCIHSKCTEVNRSVLAYRTCYTKCERKRNMDDEFKVAYNIGERFPAYSREWVRYLKELYSFKKHVIAHDIASAYMIRVLYSRYGVHRHVEGIGGRIFCVDDHITDPIIKKHPIRAERVNQICHSMNEYIKSFKGA